MAKPATLGGYSDHHTRDCERVLVTLLRGLGPWKESVYLIGGLTPKALAFDQRFERKDAHDLIYCIEYASSIEVAADAFRNALGGKHRAVIEKSLGILRKRFAQDPDTDGYRKDGPVAVAKFEFGEGPDQRERRALRQRRVSDLIEQLLARLDLGIGQDPSRR